MMCAACARDLRVTVEARVYGEAVQCCSSHCVTTLQRVWAPTVRSAQYGRALCYAWMIVGMLSVVVIML
jgi:hypothetical protein